MEELSYELSKYFILLFNSTTFHKPRKNNWRTELGYEEADPYNRKAIGDFACYIVFLNSICSR